MMKVEMGKKYTSGGRPVCILSVDRNDISYPIIGMRNDGSMFYFKEDGSCAFGEWYNLVEVWEPTVGEWCLFWDETAKYHANLRRYSGMHGVSFKTIDGLSWTHCAKFNGELPEHLKGL
jgi:hypothetical protein